MRNPRLTTVRFPHSLLLATSMIEFPHHASSITANPNVFTNTLAFTLRNMSPSSCTLLLLSHYSHIMDTKFTLKGSYERLRLKLVLMKSSYGSMGLTS